jgi:hypothetical protein
MINQTSVYWVTVLDVVGIFLCGLIIVYLIYNKIMYRHLIIASKLHNTEGSFNNKITYQLIKQMADQTFATISDRIEEERQFFKQMIENEMMIKNESIGSNPKYYPFASQDVAKYPADPPNIESDHDSYVEVLHLTTAGLTARQISERLNIPAGEIELFLRLKGHSQ